VERLWGRHFDVFLPTPSNPSHPSQTHMALGQHDVFEGVTEEIL
jgi:hypothetical protein